MSPYDNNNIVESYMSRKEIEFIKRRVIRNVYSNVKMD